MSILYNPNLTQAWNVTALHIWMPIVLYDLS